ncbi:NtaA/DmoA family FMN-dependent monooxygenase [Leucobacter soli]|uniref:NtaA/DmoA family FMN-dependent monooxygenase n=1 Tax=Leucobacter soli TaxID=2812850 RepID=UPI003607D608
MIGVGDAGRIHLNLFTMNTVGHLSPGVWRHRRDRSRRYTELDYWLGIARTAEAGLLDAVFFADVLGSYDVYRGGPEAAIAGGVQVPVNDPLQLVPAMASVTEHLGFGVTASTSFEHPFPFARRMSTLDHLTGGRVGWNVVTSYLGSGARNLGLDGQVSHDRRYDIAEEYLEVCYKLWQRSWEDDAVIEDRERGVFADPERVHPIAHRGEFFTVPGFHLSEPSPQRTPSSTRPARHPAASPSPPVTRSTSSSPPPAPRCSGGRCARRTRQPSPPAARPRRRC